MKKNTKIQQYLFLMWYWHKNTSEILETDPYIYINGNLIYDKAGITNEYFKKTWINCGKPGSPDGEK